MTIMIERVKNAIKQSDIQSNVERYPDVSREVIERQADELDHEYEAQARAAIAEMDEPTEAMIKAALALDDGIDWVKALFLSDYNSAQELYADVWKAMHNTALQEGKEEGE